MAAPSARAQLNLTLRTWGGARRGAGRKPATDRAEQPHVAREHFTSGQPVHVTLRVLEHVWNLRSQRSFRVVHDALARAARRRDFAVAHYAIQSNHVHLLVEASGPSALGRGVRGLSIAIARGMNRLMARSGAVFEDRYHAHVLRTPAEARNALRYVLGNRASHARRRGEPLADGFVDPYSSAVASTPRVGQLALWSQRPTAEPRTWLLRRASSAPGEG
jgi:putative transposase